MVLKCWKRNSAVLGASLSLLAMTALCYGARNAVKPQVIDKLPAKGNSLYISNKAPMQPSPLVKLPIGAITPKGWLRTQLQLDADGEVGKLQEISPWLKDGCAWASPTGEGHSAWEEPVYWLRGYSNLGYALGDEKIIATTRRWVDAMIASRQPDGYFGPKELKTRTNGKPDIWPHTLALNILQSYYEYTNDKRALDTITGYFKWMNTLSNEDFRRDGLANIRGIEFIATLQWLYNRTGDASLLELSKRIQESIADWRERLPTPHNVDIAQCFRGPAQYWVQSGDIKYLNATRNRYDEVMGQYGQFPGGGFAGDENLGSSVDPRQGFETCGFVEFMHSFQILTKIEGDPLWADRCEEIAFNSYPAALTADHKGLHYVTSANMVSQDFRNRSMTFTNGWVKTGYSACDYRCCQHNHSIGWSFYAQELWLATADKGLCASLYAASDVKAKVGNGTEVKITEETDYPFNETINLKLSMQKNVQFPLYLRVPNWCDAPRVAINGKAIEVKAKPLSYIVLSRTWKNGDKVTLTLRMRLQTKTWEKNKDSVSVKYGPIWFSLKIGEDWQKRDRIKDWPDYEVQPTTPWNYGLVLDSQTPEKSFKLIKKKGPVAAVPFTQEAVPFELQAKARRIPEWTLAAEKWIAPLQPSPAKTTEPVETITLIPMAAARLRISSFPTVTSDPSAKAWTATKLPFAAPFKISASFSRDMLDAINDGMEPTRSDEGGIPRVTWWNHKGTAEWLQYTFDKPRAVSAVSVYWFDDTGHGECRVPASWKLLYMKDDEWKPVVLTTGPWTALEGSEQYAVKKDEFNTVHFEKVTAEALRLEVQLQENYSGGIFEWKVTE